MAQESWKREKKETECHAPEGLILCVNNCGFSGSPATMNLCFKCYNEVILLKAPGSCGMEKLPEVFSIQRPDLVLPEEVQFAFRRPNDGSGSSCSAVGVGQEPQQPIRQTSFQSLTFLEVMQVLDHANHDYQALHTAALSG